MTDSYPVCQIVVSPGFGMGWDESGAPTPKGDQTLENTTGGGADVILKQ